MSNRQIVGKAIKHFRRRAGLTQDQLADLVGVTREQIRRIEAGTSFPGFGTFFAIAETLGVAPTSLLRMYPDDPGAPGGTRTPKPAGYQVAAAI
jgi:transcriptional regulator with XRE-family HTH domain